MLSLSRSQLITRILVAILALTLVSCGSDDNGGSVSTTTTGTSTGASGTTGTTGATATTTGATADALVTAPANMFSATLSGAEEVPATPSTATGTGIVLFDPTTRMMRATITTAGIEGTDAHIHLAPRGQAGPIVFPMTQTAPGSGVWVVETTLNDTNVAALTAGNYYFNVHTAAFPAGEIRGQIVAQIQSGALGGTATTGAAATGTGITTGSGATTSTGTPTGSGTTTSTGTGTATGAGAGTGAGTVGTSGGATATAVGFRTFVKVLTGTQTAAAGSAPMAVGVAIVDPATRTVTASVTAMGLTPSAASLREGGTTAGSSTAAVGTGAAGTAGLASGAALATLSQSTASPGVWFGRAALTDAQLTSLTSGNASFVVQASGLNDIRIQVTQTGGAGVGNTGAAGAATTGAMSTGTGTAGAGTSGSGTGTGATTGTGAAGAGATGTTGSPTYSGG